MKFDASKYHVAFIYRCNDCGNISLIPGTCCGNSLIEVTYIDVVDVKAIIKESFQEAAEELL